MIAPHLFNESIVGYKLWNANDEAEVISLEDNVKDQHHGDD